MSAWHQEEKDSGVLRGTDRRSAVYFTVDRYVHYGTLGVQGWDDVPILWRQAKCNESWKVRSRVWARNYNNKGDSSRASCANSLILVLDCFTSCLCSFFVARPRPSPQCLYRRHRLRG